MAQPPAHAVVRVHDDRYRLDRMAPPGEGQVATVDRIRDRRGGPLGCAIQRGRSMVDLADRGQPFAAALRQPALAQRALQHGWDEPVLVPPGRWELPAGAFGTSPGPT